MPRFKKSNRSLSAFQRIASLGIPTHIAIAPLGLGAELDLDNGPEGAFHPVSSLTTDGVDLTIIGLNNGRGSRISLLERIVENQQPPTPEIMTTTLGGGSVIPGRCTHLPLLGLLLVILITSQNANLRTELQVTKTSDSIKTSPIFTLMRENRRLRAMMNLKGSK